LVLSVLKIASRDIIIRHHFTGNLFSLNLYLHKGYWYYGKKREQTSMKRFSEIIKPGMNVLEIGGHIGYISSYFSFLVGSTGKVTVFEPGKNNLDYLRRNISYSKEKNITLEEKAAGNQNCSMTFYIDPITGQNNTLIKDFEGFCRNRKLSAQPNSIYQTDTVEVVRLDDYLRGKELPDFIKIDIEGYEWECLEGLKATIEKKRPFLMIEIQLNAEKILKYFKSMNYKVFNDKLNEIVSSETSEKIYTPNIFFFPQ
jgi:FkbM family methyltransferase